MLFIKIFNQYIKKYGHKYKDNDVIDIIKDSNMKDINIYRYYIYNRGIYSISDNCDASNNEMLNVAEELYILIKHYTNIINRFFKKCKYNKLIKYDMEHDLCFEPLESFPKKYRISLVQNKTIYFFRISDLIGIWTTCLRNSEGLFPKPTDIKNPHTNVLFKKHNLYNIYFKCMETGFHIPTIITDFFKNDFNMNLFYDNCYPSLKQLCIENYTENASLYDIYEAMTNMFYEYRKTIGYKTLEVNPTRTTVKNCIKLFSTHLKLYLTYKYSCNPILKKPSNLTCKRLLKAIFENRQYEDLDIPIVNDRVSRLRDNPIIRTPPPPPPPPVSRSNLSTQIHPPGIPERPTSTLPPINTPTVDISNSFLATLLGLNEDNDIGQNNIPVLSISESIRRRNRNRNRNRNRINRRRSIYSVDLTGYSTASSITSASIDSNSSNEFNYDPSMNPFQPRTEISRSPQNTIQTNTGSVATASNIRNNFNIFRRR